jgi:hypothetical protein
MYKILKYIFKNIFPESIWKYLRLLNKKVKSVLFRLKLKKISDDHMRALKKVQHKDKIKVAFFLIHDSIWKYEGVYRLLENDKRFEPIVVICPYTNSKEEIMFREMNQAFLSFTNQRYKVINTFNASTNQWLNVKKDINPDIIFFTNPHEITKTEYYITNFRHCLTCYSPYGYMLSNTQDMQFNKPFHNLLWKGFYETPIHKNMAEKYAWNKGRNITTSGSPMCDKFLDNSYIPTDPWKIKDRNVKRIIWAPHHTIEENTKILGYSNFLKYYDFMLDFLKSNRDKIQIAFKPHPLLRSKLYELKDWGKEKTDRYYKEWDCISNGQLEEGAYEDLFLTSDAMILDSISFVVEYFFLKKPLLFMVKDKNVLNKLNEFGEMIFKQLYLSNNIKDIRTFIDQIVIKNDDYLLGSRELFKEKYLLPPNNQSASYNIYHELVKELQP